MKVDVAKGAHAHRVRLAGLSAAVVLEQERHTAEGAIRQHPFGIEAGSFILAVNHDVELWIQPFDPLDGVFDELARMHQVVAHQFGLGRGVEVNEGIVHR